MLASGATSSTKGSANLVFGDFRGVGFDQKT
jgi:hypothetical protein